MKIAIFWQKAASWRKIKEEETPVKIKEEILSILREILTKLQHKT